MFYVNLAKLLDKDKHPEDYPEYLFLSINYSQDSHKINLSLKNVFDCVFNWILLFFDHKYSRRMKIFISCFKNEKIE